MMLRDILLILASICFLILLGAATYEHIAVIPAWSEAPPSSFYMFQGDHALRAGNFWMAIHPVTLLLMIGALITNWNTPRRKTILIVLIGYVVVLGVSFAYFVPVLMGFMESPYSQTVDQDLLARTSMWETLSLIRLLFILVLAYILLTALMKPNTVVVVKASADVPLTYRNDALGG